MCNDGAIDVGDGISLSLQQQYHLLQQADAVCSGIAWVGVGKMSADVPQCRCTQQGIHHCVHQHICIRMTQQSFLPRDFHPAQNQLSPLCQSVYVVPVSCANLHPLLLLLLLLTCHRLCHRNVLWRSNLDVAVISFTQLHRMTDVLHQLAVIGKIQSFPLRLLYCTAV